MTEQRLYGPEWAEDLDSDLDAAIETYDAVNGPEVGTVVVFGEYDVLPPRSHFPDAGWTAEWVAEWAANNDTCEPFGDQAVEAAQDPEVVAAFEAAIDALASRITYRQADSLVAKHRVRFDGDGEYVVEVVEAAR